MKTLIAQGAEAKLFKTGTIILKERVPKSYRLKEIDKKLRIQRTRSEAKILAKAAKVINVPKVINADETSGKIEMKFIEGKKIADCLNFLERRERLTICKQIGKETAQLHNAEIIHGDLTTSNMILNKNNIFFIDFGLSFIHTHPEHKAVDLHLLKQALESKHWKHFESSFEAVLEGYKEKVKNAEKILSRFEIVESRGRYKRKGS